MYKKIKGGEWEESGRTEKTKLLVKGLKSNSSYEFQVIATNKTLMSLSSDVSRETQISTAAAVGMCAGGGVLLGVLGSLFLPAAVGMTHEAFKEGDTEALEDISDTKSKLLLGLSIAALPISIVLAPVTLPVMTGAAAKWIKDLSKPEELSDDD